MRRFITLLLSVAIALCVIGGITSTAKAAVIVSDDSGVVLSTTGYTVILSETLGITNGSLGISVSDDSTMDMTLAVGGLDSGWFGSNDYALTVRLDGDVVNAARVTNVWDRGYMSGYTAFYDDVALTGGSHTLTIAQTGGSAGAARYTITIEADGTVGGAPSAVPEPATMTLLATGLVGLVGLRRRQRRQQKAAD